MRAFYKAGEYGMKNSIGYMIRRTGSLLVPQLETLFADADLTFSQWTVLMVLREWQSANSAEIARHICHDAGSLARVMEQLEKRGLIARSRNEDDRRLVTLTLTARGRAMVEGLVPKVVAYWNELLSDFSDSEARALLKLLARLTEAAEKAESRPRRAAKPVSKSRAKVPA